MLRGELTREAVYRSKPRQGGMRWQGAIDVAGNVARPSTHPEMRAPPVDDWQWRAELSARALRVVGDTTLDLLQRGHRWVHRRVETLTFVDAGVVRRQLSVDFSLPKKLPTPLKTPSGEPLYYVPLTFLPRNPGPMKFDVRDENGRALPLIVEREHSRITARALIALAGRTLQNPWLVRQLEGPLGERLARIPFRFYPETAPLVRSILNPHSREWRQFPVGVAARNRLRNNPRFADFLALVAGNSVTVVPLVGRAGVRTVVKLTYEETLDPAPPTPGRRSFFEWLAWSSNVASLSMPLIGAAETHHVQITVPSNLEMTMASLASWSPVDLTRPRILDEDLPVARYRDFRPGFATRAHLYIPRSHALTSGIAEVGLRAERRGILTGCAIAGVAIALVLFGYWRAADTLVNQSNAGTALLLLAPALAAGYLIRPGEHAIVRKLLSVPRGVLALSTALTFLAAAALFVLGPRHPNSIVFTKTASGRFVEHQSALTASHDLKRTLLILFVVGAINAGILFVSRVAPWKQKTAG